MKEALDFTELPIFGETEKKGYGGVKPVCANCKHLVEGSKKLDCYTCEPVRGIIPKECADNLTCVRSHHPNFEAKERVNHECV